MKEIVNIVTVAVLGICSFVLLPALVLFVFANKKGTYKGVQEDAEKNGEV